MANNVATKQTKKGLMEYLQNNLTEMSKEMAQQVQDALKIGSKLTLDELKELSKEVATDLIMGGTPVIENEVKAGAKKTISKKNTTGKPAKSLEQQAKDGEVTDLHALAKQMKGDQPKAEDKPKADSKPKADNKPKATGKTSKNEVTVTTGKHNDKVDKFPATLDLEVGKLTLNEKAQTMEDLLKDFEAGKSNVFAIYWNKRQLKQFTYDPIGVNKTAPKNFPSDLDIVQPMYINEEGKVLYAVSVYTEVVYVFLPHELEVDEDTNLRYVNGAEYQIYTMSDEE